MDFIFAVGVNRVYCGSFIGFILIAVICVYIIKIRRWVKLHSFILKLVPKFEEQRKPKKYIGTYEFAVLFLSSEKTVEDVLDEMQFHTK